MLSINNLLNMRRLFLVLKHVLEFQDITGTGTSLDLIKFGFPFHFTDFSYGLWM